VKEDSSHIRASIHDIKNEQQKAVAAELQCAKSLAALEQQVTGLTAQIGHFAQSLSELMAHRYQGTGAWRMAARIGAVILGLFTCAGAVASSIILVSEHLK